MTLEKVYIATPSAAGIVTSAYAGTLITVAQALGNRKVRFTYTNFDGSDVVIARNYLGNRFVRDTTCSHVLFIDSDMAIPAEVFGVMFDSGKEFIGTIYPERKIDLQKYGEHLLKGNAHPAALASALKFHVRHFDNSVSIESGLCRVRGIGFGCVLIARSVFESLIAKNGVHKLVSSAIERAGLTGDSYDFFGEIGLDNGDVLSEDYSFCERVFRAKICDIWAVAGMPVGHVGQFVYGGSYVEKLRAIPAGATPKATPKVAKR